MKNQATQNIARSKTAPIAFLYGTSILIVLAGAAFGIYSAIANVGFAVLDSEVPGFVLGVLMVFLGVRYFLSVRKLSVEVYKDTSRFSWENFRSLKTQKRKETRP